MEDENIKILNDIFTYHSPDVKQSSDLVAVRDMAKQFAILLHEHVPDGPDKVASIRKLRECVMTANQAIMLKGVSYPAKMYPDPRR